MSNTVISELGQHYHKWVAKHPAAARDFADAIQDTLSDAGVTYDVVKARVKAWPSLLEKARKRNADGGLEYANPWKEIHDLIGVRVVTYHSTEIPRAVEVLSRSFTLVRSVDKAAETRIAGNFGYGSHHLILKVNEQTEGLDDYVGQVFEVQIRTILQHAWAEFEHDIRYKRGAKDLDPRVDRAFTLAAGLIELADQQFDIIAALQSPTVAPSDTVDLRTEMLPGLLTLLLGSRYPLALSDHYDGLFQQLVANDITTVAQLRTLVNPHAIAAVTNAMQYRYRPSQVRIVDDIMLYKFREEYITRTGNIGNRVEHRPERLRARLARLDGHRP